MLCLQGQRELLCAVHARAKKVIVCCACKGKDSYCMLRLQGQLYVVLVYCMLCICCAYVVLA